MGNNTSVRYYRKTSRGTNRQRERIIQRALTRWLCNTYPTIDFYNDWSSGAYLTEGQNKARLTIASRNGWVDLFIAEPSRGYHGLFIELKKEGVRPYLKDGKTLSANIKIRQEAEFLERQRNKGYCAMFACGLEVAKAKIDWYFEREQPELPF